MTRLLERLAVAHLRLADADLEAEIALHAVPLHFQVQRAHAVHEHLAGVLVDLHDEGRVFALQLVEDVGQLVLVGARFRLDPLADDRFGERDRLQQDRVLRLAQACRR